jgi:hypothetical protein
LRVSTSPRPAVRVQLRLPVLRIQPQLLSAHVLLAGGIAPRDHDDAAYGVMGPIGVAGLLLESTCRA